MHFVRAQARHSGKYLCVAENEAGEAEAVLSLLVLTQPRIHAPPPSMRNVAALLGERLSLSCHAEGQPAPEIVWLFDGQTVQVDDDQMEQSPDQHQLRLQDTNLVVEKLGRQHAGRYTCVAMNKAGRTEADVFVDVLGEC